MRKIKVVSIYSGAGGLDLGFHKAGFRNIFSTDYWQPACNSLKKNKISNQVICDDIRNINFQNIVKEERVDCLIGGPPCPAYSKSRFYLKDKKRAMEDENSFTLHEYFKSKITKVS